jgi:hypothetical protein
MCEPVKRVNLVPRAFTRVKVKSNVLFGRVEGHYVW